MTPEQPKPTALLSVVVPAYNEEGTLESVVERLLALPRLLEVVVVQDADLEYDPAEIPLVIRPILEGRADVVYGSRLLARRAARGLYFYHHLGDKLLTFLSNRLTGLDMTDIETGSRRSGSSSASTSSARSARPPRASPRRGRPGAAASLPRSAVARTADSARAACYDAGRTTETDLGWH